MSALDSLAVAAVAAMNGRTWDTVEFTAVYDLLPDFTRETMGAGLHVCILPAQKRTDGRLDRRRSKMELGLDIGLAIRLGADSQNIATLRPWIMFAESVQTWFDETQTTLAGCEYQRSEFDPLYHAALLRQESVFFSVLSVTYRRN
jgi:hypothetical protein